MKTPLDSLHSIFSIWRPQTAASSEQQLEVLDAIRRRYSNAAWSLMLDLLPRTGQLSLGTAMPRWHSWVPQRELLVAYGEIDERTRNVSDRLLTDVVGDTRRWTQLIGVADDLPPSGREQLVQSLENVERQSLDEGDLVAFRDALRKVISHHWEYPEAEWALPDEFVTRLFEQYNRLEPTDPVDRHAWVFVQWPKIPARRDADHSYETEQRIAQEWRASALRDVLAVRDDLDSLLRLVSVVEVPWLVGFTLASTDRQLVGGVLQRMTGSDDERERQTALGVLAGLAQTTDRGRARISEILGQPGWTPRQRGEIYLSLPFEPATWDLLDLEADDTAAHYWSLVDPHGRGSDLPLDTAIRASREYLAWRQPARALRILALYGIPGELNLKLAILDALVASTPTDPIVWRDLGNDLIETLASLGGTEGESRDRLATIEWYFLPVLSEVRFGYRPAALDAVLASNPEFFVTVLSTVYRPEEADDSPVSEQDRERAHAGFKLLNNWATLPGLRADERLDGSELRTWATEVLSLAEHRKLESVAKVNIGHVLAFSPEGEDGLWPDIEVRNLIETLASEDVERGFEIQVFNNRGSTTRRLDEGGLQEREVARHFQTLAASTSQAWPRTGATLRRIALNYEADARREDDRSARMANRLEP